MERGKILRVWFVNYMVWERVFEDMEDRERILSVIVMEDIYIDCSLFMKKKAIGTDSYLSMSSNTKEYLSAWITWLYLHSIKHSNKAVSM